MFLGKKLVGTQLKFCAFLGSPFGAKWPLVQCLAVQIPSFFSENSARGPQAGLRGSRYRFQNASTSALASGKVFLENVT